MYAELSSGVVALIIGIIAVKPNAHAPLHSIMKRGVIQFDKRELIFFTDI